jgi:hypothetical protein
MIPGVRTTLTDSGIFAGALLAFGLAWWLGLYLIARNPSRPLLRRAGLGLLAYALALALDVLRGAGGGPLLGRAASALLFLPALSWSGATLLLLPEGARLRAALDRAWRLGLAPLGGLAIGAAALGGLLDRPWGPPGPAYLALSALVLLPLALALGLLLRVRAALRPASAVGLLGAGTLFFGMGAALLLFPLELLPRWLMSLGIGLDLALLGLAAAGFDAFDEGETLRPDMLRSLLGAGAAATLFGGQVGLAMLAGAGAGRPMLALLLGCVAAAVAAQVLGGPLQGLLDQLAFASSPRLRQARAELRAGAAALPRQDPDLDLDSLGEAEFARLTRRAFGHYGDLPRLAASPLTRLPALGARLAARGAPDQPLERAAELKALLAERVARLRPRGAAGFGTSDEWRHYNALYFPYIVGLRPYSRRAEHAGLDADARQALEWLATQVPERTLYNWQNAAARLVAADLRVIREGG